MIVNKKYLKISLKRNRKFNIIIEKYGCNSVCFAESMPTDQSERIVNA